MNPDTAVAPVTLAMLKTLHREHLRGGAAATADAIRRFAVDLGTSPAAVVRGVRVAVAASEPEVAGWAKAVAPYVEGAAASGALTEHATR